MNRTKKVRPSPPMVGWREWVALPQLSIAAVKAKIDTGARSSALHAFDVQTFERRGVTWVRFQIHPLQRNSRTVVQAEARLLEWRRVRSSIGHETLRPVIITELKLLEDGPGWPIELTLVNRDAMGFRMLLGRQALRQQVRIDPGRSYLTGKPPAAVRGVNKKKIKTRPQEKQRNG